MHAPAIITRSPGRSSASRGTRPCARGWGAARVAVASRFDGVRFGEAFVSLYKRCDERAGELSSVPATATVAAGAGPWGFAEFFVISQTALPALLYLPGTQGFRLASGSRPLRSACGVRVVHRAAEASESAPGDHRGRRHHVADGCDAGPPATPSLVGGLAHLAVYFAVLAPVFWAPAFVRSPERFARLMALLLICSGVNSLVGVLQVYDPDTWMPANSRA